MYVWVDRLYWESAGNGRSRHAVWSGVHKPNTETGQLRYSLTARCCCCCVQLAVWRLFAGRFSYSANTCSHIANCRHRMGSKKSAGGPAIIWPFSGETALSNPWVTFVSQKIFEGSWLSELRTYLSDFPTHNQLNPCVTRRFRNDVPTSKTHQLPRNEWLSLPPAAKKIQREFEHNQALSESRWLSTTCEPDVDSRRAHQGQARAKHEHSGGQAACTERTSRGATLA